MYILKIINNNKGASVWERIDTDMEEVGIVEGGNKLGEVISLYFNLKYVNKYNKNNYTKHSNFTFPIKVSN